MAIRYKVLRNRTSCMARGKYNLIYTKNYTVHKVKNTLGIMTFKRKRDALNFVEKFWGIDDPYIDIIKVKTTTRGKTPNYITQLTSESEINSFYLWFKEHIIEKHIPLDYQEPPQGTLCYDEVKVLE